MSSEEEPGVKPSSEGASPVPALATPDAEPAEGPQAGTPPTAEVAAAAETPEKATPAETPAQASTELGTYRRKLRFWRFVCFLLALVLVGLGYLAYQGRIKYVPAATEPATNQNPFKLRDEQLRVTDGTIPLRPPNDPSVDIGESFVDSAMLEAARWYKAYFAGTEVPAFEPVIFGLSTLRRDSFPTLCLPQDVNADFGYAFYCRDEHTVWVPHTTLLVGTRRPGELGLEPNIRPEQYSARFAWAVVGVFAYSSALVDHLATGPGGHWVPLYRTNDGLVAACFTGAWADTGRALEEPTVSAALGAIKRYGEPRLLSRHSREALESAFRLGQETGRPLACLSAYWPWAVTPPGLTSVSPPSPRVAKPSAAPSATPSTTR